MCFLGRNNAKWWQVTYIKQDWQKVKHLEEQWPRHEPVRENGQGVKTQLSTWSHFSETRPSPSPSPLGVACNLQSVGTELLCTKVPPAFLSDAHVFLFYFYLSQTYVPRHSVFLSVFSQSEALTTPREEMIFPPNSLSPL